MWFKQISFYPLNTAKLPELDTLADKQKSTRLNSSHD